MDYKVKHRKSDIKKADTFKRINLFLVVSQIPEISSLPDVLRRNGIRAVNDSGFL